MCHYAVVQWINTHCSTLPSTTIEWKRWFYFFIKKSIALNCFALNASKWCRTTNTFVGYNDDWGSPPSSHRLCHFVRHKMHHHVDYKSINHKFFLFVSNFHLTANGRAPLEPYYGRYIGNFTEFAHKIKGIFSFVFFWFRPKCDTKILKFHASFVFSLEGDVYAIDESTLFIKGFAYDGTGPDAFFWVGR